MLTFNQLYTRALDFCGVSASDATTLGNVKSDIKQGLALFKNSSRRYWTRKEITANLVSSQQFYTFPEDVVRITEVRVNSSGLNFPVLPVDSEAMWNRINIIPAMTINLPMYYFVRGRNEIGLWPIPTSNVSAGLVISYEPRLPDMSLADTTTTTVNVANGSQTVSNPSSPFNTNMNGMWFSVTDGSDGNWYPIIGASTTTLTLENYYQGPSVNNVACIIGSVPDIPEDYHLGLAYFAAYNFYLKRNEMANANEYKALYEDLLERYRDTYADKTTGQVQQSIENYRYSLFTLPPNPIT